MGLDSEVGRDPKIPAPPPLIAPTLAMKGAKTILPVARSLGVGAESASMCTSTRTVAQPLEVVELLSALAPSAGVSADSSFRLVSTNFSRSPALAEPGIVLSAKVTLDSTFELDLFFDL